MPSHPALMLTSHVGCVLTLKGDFYEVRSLWFLEIQVSRLGKVLHLYLGPPNTTSTHPKGLSGFGMYTWRLGIYSAEHSGLGQASSLLCGLLLPWTEFLRSSRSAFPSLWSKNLYGYRKFILKESCWLSELVHACKPCTREVEDNAFKVSLSYMRACLTQNRMTKRAHVCVAEVRME